MEEFVFYKEVLDDTGDVYKSITVQNGSLSYILHTHDRSENSISYRGCDQDDNPKLQWKTWFDDEMHELKTLYYNHDGSIPSSRTYTYDEQGRQTLELWITADDKIIDKVVTEYNDQKLTATKRSSDEDGPSPYYRIIQYDGEGRILSRSGCSEAEGQYEITTYEYENGLKVSSTYTSRGRVISRREFRNYDEGKPKLTLVYKPDEKTGKLMLTHKTVLRN